MPAKNLLSYTLHQGAKAYDLVNSEEFVDFADTPGVFRHAAINNPGAPEESLRAVKTTVARLEQNEEFADWRDTPGVFRHAAINNSGAPEEFLRRVKTTVARLEQNEEFADWRDTPGMFRHAAIYNPGAPEEFLRRAGSNLRLLQENGGFASMPASLLKKVAVFSQCDPQESLRRHKEAQAQLPVPVLALGEP